MLDEIPEDILTVLGGARGRFDSLICTYCGRRFEGSTPNEAQKKFDKHPCPKLSEALVHGKATDSKQASNLDQKIT